MKWHNNGTCIISLQNVYFVSFCKSYREREEHVKHRSNDNGCLSESIMQRGEGTYEQYVF